MTTSFVSLLVGLLGFAAGAAAMLFWKSSRPVPTAPAMPSSTLELHLVLNALNRVVLALGADERAQDGVADLADYLRSSDELRRRPRPEAMLEAVSSYWRMSRWLHGRPTDSLHLDAQLADASPATLSQICIELTQAIRDLESCPQANVSARVGLEGEANARTALIQIAVAGVAPAQQAQLASLPRGWSRSAAQLSLRQVIAAAA
ncbi:MAG: hypothetical protein EKK53_13420 [Burkholderiales bacterium]|nr:MAG: hypothetical protein EKK53_13420 [Burkholderiales bacterium]